MALDIVQDLRVCGDVPHPFVSQLVGGAHFRPGDPLSELGNHAIGMGSSFIQSFIRQEMVKDAVTLSFKNTLLVAVPKIIVNEWSRRAHTMFHEPALALLGKVIGK